MPCTIDSIPYVGRVVGYTIYACTSLKDRVAGRVPDGCNIGPKRYLTYEEENELVEFILKCSKMECGKTRQDVMKLLESCFAKKEDLKRKSNKLSTVGGLDFFKDGLS